LLGGKGADAALGGHQYSTLGIGQTDSLAETHNHSETHAHAESLDHSEAHDHSNVKVFIEAPVMESFETNEVPEKTCEPDIEMQTADTMKLSAVDGEDASATFESSSTNNNSGKQTMETQVSHDSHDSFLDLDGAGGLVATEVADDFVLDLEDEAALEIFDYAAVAEPAVEMAPEPFAQPEELPQAEFESAEASAPAFVEEKQEDLTALPVASSELSPAAIEAIARRVVEQMSEKIVREIAWDVVPELAELLIKQKLDEQKH